MIWWTGFHGRSNFRDCLGQVVIWWALNFIPGWRFLSFFQFVHFSSTLIWYNLIIFACFFILYHIKETNMNKYEKWPDSPSERHNWLHPQLSPSSQGALASHSNTDSGNHRHESHLSNMVKLWFYSNIYIYIHCNIYIYTVYLYMYIDISLYICIYTYIYIFTDISLFISRSSVKLGRVSDADLRRRLYGYKFFAQATAVCPEPLQEIALAPQESARWEQRPPGQRFCSVGIMGNTGKKWEKHGER